MQLANKILLLFLASSTLSYATLKNKIYYDLFIKNNGYIRNLFVDENAQINGNLTVQGIINASTGTYVKNNGTSTTNAVARFADTSGTVIENSSVLVDNSGNVQLNGITKNNNTVSWPSVIGAMGTFLGSDGSGNLIYALPSGSGNVSTANPFTVNNSLVTTDLPSSSTNIKQATVTLDGSGNIAGVNTLDATTINATTFNGALNGNASSATNFTGNLSGDVTGTQSATVVSAVDGQSAANVASATVAANAATNANTANTIVKRDASGNFIAGTITANLTGNVTGNLSGTATNATNATTAVNFSGSLTGDVTGTQTTTLVNSVGGQTSANIASATTAANAATNLNTASTIVKRDGSGNFAAGTITANLTGNVTGNLSGNATTATSATTATTATNFSGSLSGDVTGTQSATVVSTVGGQSAANVASATVAANAATSTNTVSTIVKRDASGNFSTNMVTINGTVTNPTDAATKDYVDTAVSTGFNVKTPAVVVAITNITLSGTQTIDGVALNANDRVLLTNQTNPVENGLWLVQAGAWTRPTDFASGTEATEAYVLILEGTTEGGSSWVCNTPTAIIDTDPLTFVLFSQPGKTTAANVGTGTGQIFRDKTGNTINLKTLAAGTHMVVTNNTDDITLSTDATNANTASTIVARDASGNFSAGTITAALTGSASNNVLKAGDTMTGNLNLALQSAVRWQDNSGSGNYVGFNAPALIGTSYTTNLPSTAPAIGQVLQASSPAALIWATIGGSPTVAKTYYVSLSGNDSNDGSLNAPFRTVSHAVSVANTVATRSNPIVISIGAGIFLEDNSAGPITITADGISMVGSSMFGTVITPSTLSNNLLSLTTANIELYNLALIATGSSTAAAVDATFSANGTGIINSIVVQGFQTGIALSSSGGMINMTFENVLSSANGTGIAINNVALAIRNSVFVGSTTTTPLNTAITATGTATTLGVLSSAFRLLNTAINITGGTFARIIGNNIDNQWDSMQWRM